jgi:Major tropism determinant N-terminal domain
MAIEIQIRRDTAANWTSVDPTLAEGEFGLETDTNQLKIGDGVLAWTALAYFGGSANPFDQDLNTTDPVVFAGLTNNAIIYPTVDGTAGQSIVTDGAGNLSFASGANPFDQSLNIADAVSFTGLTNNAIIYPSVDGTVGQIIVTDGAGNLSFASTANPFDQDLNTTDAVSFTGLTNNAIIYPTSDGTVGQVITTDGAGNLSFGSYLPLAGGAMDDTAIVTLSNTGTDRDTEIGGWGLGTQKTSDNDYSATFEYDQILIKDGTQTTTIKTNTITTGGSYIERQVAASFTAGTLTLDCNLANVFTHALTANVTTVTIDNIPISGLAIGITLILEADGTQRTITWPASFLWSGGTAPTITATNAKKDAIVFMTYDQGTTFLAFVAGQNL